MNETYLEQIIERTPPKSAGLVKALLVLLCIFSCVMVLLPYGIGLVAMALVIAFTVWKFRSYNVEYEYSYLNGELDIDKITCRSSRKKCGTFDFTKLELMAPVGSQSDLRLSHKKYKEFDYSSGNTDNRKYAAYVMKDQETVKLIFEPDEDMYKAIQYLSRGRVFND